MTYIIADFADRDYISGLQAKTMLGSYPFQVLTARNMKELLATSGEQPDATILIAANVLDATEFAIDSFKGFTIWGFAKNVNEAGRFKSLNYTCVAISRTEDKLLEKLQQKPIPVFCTTNEILPVGANMDVQTQQPVQQPSNTAQAIQLEQPAQQPQTPILTTVTPNPIPTQQFPNTSQTPIQQPIQTPQTGMPVTPTPTDIPAQGIPQTGAPVNPAPSIPTPEAPAAMSPEYMAAMMQFFQMMQSQQNGQPVQPTIPPQPQQVPMQPQAPQVPQNIPQTMPKTAPEETSSKQPKEKKKNRLENRAKKDAVDQALEKDGVFRSYKKKDKAIVVTVYAAKGGVGKTTIATETATYLSLTNFEGQRLSVCIVDYNIDFGDVCTHCDLDAHGNSMVTWAAEIEERIKNGEDMQSINYNEHEIKTSYLQRMDDTGLFALLAPTAHEDSMNISSNALRVMLRNLVENCGFDFVVCDTGNNTRDAAIISLEMADDVLLITAQDVATANCDASVIRVLQKYGLNTEKIKMVINNIIPTKEAGISVQEVADAFEFECVAKIRHTSDIIKASNLGKPLVLQPKHEFTSQIQKIAAFLTTGLVQDDNIDLETKEKKNFILRLFGRA